MKCSPDYETHFGVNREGIINVYAYDIAKLPHWQQRIWSGHNATPEGQVSSELLDSQQRCKPADTTAPEAIFARLLSELNSAFAKRYGGPIFRSHDSTEAILKRVHRFRALEVGGLLALAKDIARLTADSIDVGVLRSIIAPRKGENWRSLRHLEHALSTRVDSDAARAALSPLVGIYELRLGDAHLPSSEIIEAYKLAGVSSTDAPIYQATELITGATRSLKQILCILA